MRKIKTFQKNLFILLTLTIVSSTLFSQATTTKKVIGAIESIYVQEAGMYIEGRIDTGAGVTSIHATEITVEDGVVGQAAKGKKIRFKVTNEKGVSSYVDSRVVKVSSIKSANGTSLRYHVYMTLEWDGFSKKILVNLKDRTRMSQKLLVGRNWLKGNFVVDVEK